MKLNDCGIVIIGKQHARRPFVEWREITKGNNKGKIEVVLLTQKFVVSKEEIVRFPKEANGNITGN